RAFHVVDFPAREVRAADVPALAPAVGRQHEGAFAGADQNAYSAHVVLPPEVKTLTPNVQRPTSNVQRPTKTRAVSAFCWTLDVGRSSHHSSGSPALSSTGRTSTV